MTDMVGLLIGVVDWGYLVGYCIEMAYRKSHRRMSKKAGRASRKGSLKRGRRATRKGGLKRGGLSRRVKRGGRFGWKQGLEDGGAIASAIFRSDH